MKKVQYGYQGFNIIKSAIFLRDNFTCQKCGKKVGDSANVNRFGMGKIITVQLTKEDFTVHHKDCNKFNMSSSNLILLCDSCHRSIHMIHRHDPTLDKYLLTEKKVNQIYYVKMLRKKRFKPCLKSKLSEAIF